MSTENIVQVAKLAGAPKAKGAGVLLKVKLGEAVKKDDLLFEIFAERSSKLESAFELAKTLQPIALSKKAEERMLLDKVPSKVSSEKSFVLER